MFARPTPELREELPNLNGVGPETADSILLYAGNHPVFVVDAYTRRILTRHEIQPDDASMKISGSYSRLPLRRWQSRLLIQRSLLPDSWHRDFRGLRILRHG